MACLGNEQRSFCHFWDCTQYYILDPLLTMRATPFLMRFLPTMSMFTLAISCLTTSNLPWVMDLKSKFLRNIVLYSIRLYFHHQSHPQLGVVFALALPLMLSGVISPVAYWVPTDLGTSSSVSLFLPFHTVHGVVKASILIRISGTWSLVGLKMHHHEQS